MTPPKRDTTPASRESDQDFGEAECASSVVDLVAMYDEASIEFEPEQVRIDLRPADID